jgi:hypothetical protein
LSLIQASSIAITSKCKIVLRPGTIFSFGTISSIADEEGILHRVADPPEKKLSSEIPREAKVEQQVALPPASRGKENAYLKNSVVHLAHKGVDTDHSKEGSKHPESGDENTLSHLSDTFALKGGRKEERHHADSFLPRHPLHRGEIGVSTHLR